MNNPLKKIVIVGCVILCGVLLSALICAKWNATQEACVSRHELVFYYEPLKGSSPDDDPAQYSELLIDAMFRMRSAIASINRLGLRKDLVGRFVARHPEYAGAEDVIATALNGMTFEWKERPLPTVTLVSRGPSFETSRQLGEFYADTIIEYFKKESEGLTSKMIAWFETQKRGKDAAEIAKVEEQEDIALKQVEKKTLKVVLRSLVTPDIRP